MTRELPQMGCDCPSVVNPRTKVSKKRHAPSPRKAKPFGRWTMDERGRAVYTFPNGSTTWMGMKWVVDLLNKSRVDIQGRVVPKVRP
jgi:hypothetical protein